MAEAAQRRRTEPLTTAQNRCIWGMAGRIGLEEETLRDVVEHETGQRHISALTKRTAGDVIEALKVISGEQQKRHRSSPNRASVRQVYMIRNLARSMGWKNYRLTAFLEKRWGPSRPEWLSSEIAWKVIEALKAMGKRQM